MPAGSRRGVRHLSRFVDDYVKESAATLLGCAGLPLALKPRQDAVHEVEPTGRGREVERACKRRLERIVL
jgi:hypothetical protein